MHKDDPNKILSKCAAILKTKGGQMFGAWNMLNCRIPDKWNGTDC